MLDALTSGLVTGYAIAVPVGAVAVMIVAVSSRTSWPTGAAAGLGVASVDGGYALLAVLAGTAVARVLDPVSGVLTAISVAVLLAIAALTLVHAFRPARAGCADRPGLEHWTPLRAWLTLAAITAVNPATVLYFAAIVLGGTVRIDGPAEGAVFVAAAFVASASWQLFVAGVGSGLGAWLGTWLAGPRGRRTTGVVAALAIGVLALKPLV